MVILLMPTLGLAAKAPDTDWHRCASDADCVLVEGICGKAAVNPAYSPEATKYYAQEKKKAKCADEFWKPKADVAICRLEACQAISSK